MCHSAFVIYLALIMHQFTQHQFDWQYTTVAVINTQHQKKITQPLKTNPVAMRWNRITTKWLRPTFNMSVYIGLWFALLLPSLNTLKIRYALYMIAPMAALCVAYFRPYSGIFTEYSAHWIYMMSDDWVSYILRQFLKDLDQRYRGPSPALKVI